MKIRMVTLIATLSALSSACSSNISDDVVATEPAQLSKEEVVSDIANCYVAHQRFNSEAYREGEAEEYKSQLDSLVGSKERITAINIASTRQGGPNGITKSRHAKFEMEKYCTKIAQKLATLALKPTA